MPLAKRAPERAKWVLCPGGGKGLLAAEALALVAALAAALARLFFDIVECQSIGKTVATIILTCDKAHIKSDV
jgi:hypothetical protein